MKITRTLLLALGLIMTLGCLSAPPVAAAQPARIRVTIRDHLFIPRQLRVPAGVPVELTIINTDSSPVRFRIDSLFIAKTVPANDNLLVLLPPIVHGTHRFYGADYPSARGTLVVGNGG